MVELSIAVIFFIFFSISNKDNISSRQTRRKSMSKSIGFDERIDRLDAFVFFPYGRYLRFKPDNENPFLFLSKLVVRGG